MWPIESADMHEVDVIWNNGFRHIFNCSWPDSVKRLQFFCQSMPLSFVTEERLLMFFSKLHRTDNIVLQTLIHVPMVKYEILRLAVKYGLNEEREGLSTIRDTVWSCSESSVVMFTLSLLLRIILLFYVFLCVHCMFVSVCCTLCVFNRPKAKVQRNYIAHLFGTIYTVYQKNVPHLTCYNLGIHDRIMIIFGRSVTKKVGNQTMLCFPTLSIYWFCATLQNRKPRNCVFSLKH